MGPVEAPEPRGDWASLPTGPLACIFVHLASSRDLAQCCLTCKHWEVCLQSAATPWHVALGREHG
jgi:hypothetical protein